MNKKTKDSIVRSIIRIVNNVAEPSRQGVRRTKIIGTEGITFALVDEYVDEYEDISKRLVQKEGWGEKFSEKYVDNAIQKLLANILKDNAIEKTEEYFDQLIADYDNYSQEQTCYVPLAGIQMPMDAFPFGKVILRKMTADFADKLAKKIESITMLTTNTQEQKGKAAQFMRQQIKNLEGTICVEFKIVAEQERARERAEEESRRVLDLISYSIPALYPKEHNITAGLNGEIGYGSRITPIISSDERRYSINIQNVGPLTDFDLSSKHIDHMKRIGVFKVAEILQKSDRSLTDFESTLLRGIHWFANSQTQFERESEFLNLVTCLETFLTPRDSDPIGTAVAEGVAIIISTDLETRKILKKKIKDFYRMRSAISHGGRKAILDTELAELRNIAGTLTMHMIHKTDELQNQQALLNWIEDQKLGQK